MAAWRGWSACPTGALVGVLSERDVRLLEVSRRGRDLGSVREACVRDVYVVDVDTPLDEVLSHIAETHVGSALVVKNGKLAGKVDLLGPLEVTLNGRFGLTKVLPAKPYAVYRLRCPADRSLARPPGARQGAVFPVPAAPAASLRANDGSDAR